MRLRPNEPFEIRLRSGGRLLLEPGQGFLGEYYNGLSIYEPDVQAAIRHLLKPGATFVDCGANIGFYSIYAKDVMGGAGSVIAIEANPQILPVLNRNLERNGIEPAKHAAVTLKAGDVDFFCPANSDVLAGLHRTGFFGTEEMQTYRVVGRTLDELLEQLEPTRVDVIKIDIEGGELDALKSARRTVERFRPHLIVEYSSVNWPEFSATPEELLALCEEWKYLPRRYDLKLRQLVDLSQEFWKMPYANMILVPADSK